MTSRWDQSKIQSIVIGRGNITHRTLQVFIKGVEMGALGDIQARGKVVQIKIHPIITMVIGIGVCHWGVILCSKGMSGGRW